MIRFTLPSPLPQLGEDSAQDSRQTAAAGVVPPHDYDGSHLPPPSPSTTTNIHQWQRQGRVMTKINCCGGWRGGQGACEIFTGRITDASKASTRTLLLLRVLRAAAAAGVLVRATFQHRRIISYPVLQLFYRRKPCPVFQSQPLRAAAVSV